MDIYLLIADAHTDFKRNMRDMPEMVQLKEINLVSAPAGFSAGSLQVLRHSRAQVRVVFHDHDHAHRVRVYRSTRRQ